MLIRATMQNRDMASSLGVRTRNVDRFTFALGSGIAGVAGYGWTIVGGVTPDMGTKLFIVDSFLVVVAGGVGDGWSYMLGFGNWCDYKIDRTP